MEIWSRRFFFRFTYVEPKHQNNPHNQAGVQQSIWIFWVCWPCPAWFNIRRDCSQLRSQFDCYQLQLLFSNVAKDIQWEVSSPEFASHFDTSVSHSTFSIHCRNLTLHFSCIFTFLEIIKHNMQKMLLFFSFNIKMTTQKFNSLDFFNAYWYDSCHNTVLQNYF